MGTRTDTLDRLRAIGAALKTIVKERDRILTLASFPAFGVWSLLAPTPSMARLPHLAEVATYVLFILGGVLLAAASFRTWFDGFVVGHICTIGGVLTVGLVVLSTSESPVGLLILGYATALSYSLQKTLRERRLVREVADHTRPLPRVDIPDEGGGR